TSASQINVSTVCFAPFSPACSSPRCSGSSLATRSCRPRLRSFLSLMVVRSFCLLTAGCRAVCLALFPFPQAVIYAAVFGTLLALFFINALITTLGALVVLLLAEVSDDAGTKKRVTARDAVKGKPSSVAEKKQATAAVSPTAVE
ncbi:putative transmembrane protein, partial [Toxoplasma gondii RUB]